MENEKNVLKKSDNDLSEKEETLKLESETKRVWNAYSDINYDNFHKMRVAQEIMKDLKKAFVPSSGGKVLDGGCGSGMLFEMILKEIQPNKLIAGDFSERMLERAKGRIEKMKDKDKSKIELVNLDLSKKFPFPDESFDAEIFSLSINYLPYKKWKQSLDEAQRTTKRGGYIYIASQTSDFDFSEGYKREVLKEIKEKLFSGQLSFVLWMIKTKKTFVSRIDRWSKEDVIIFPNSQELLDYQKEIGFTDIEILARPFFKTCVVTRARKA